MVLITFDPNFWVIWPNYQARWSVRTTDWGQSIRTLIAMKAEIHLLSFPQFKHRKVVRYDNFNIRTWLFLVDSCIDILLYILYRINLICFVMRSKWGEKLILWSANSYTDKKALLLDLQEQNIKFFKMCQSFQSPPFDSFPSNATDVNNMTNNGNNQKIVPSKFQAFFVDSN